MKVCILIRVLPGKGKEALESVRKFPEVKKAYIVFGRYDLIALAEAPNYRAASALTARMNSIKEFKSTESLIEA